MKFQDIVSDVREHAQNARKQTQEALEACVDTQRQALGVVRRNGWTLASTEVDAARNVFASARSSFDQAREDGVFKVVSEPKSYVPRDGRHHVAAACRDSVDLLIETRNELVTVATDGCRTVRDRLTGKQVAEDREAASRKKGRAADTGVKTASATGKSTTRTRSSNRPAWSRSATVEPAQGKAASGAAAAHAVKPTARKTAAKRRDEATGTSDKVSSMSTTEKQKAKSTATSRRRKEGRTPSTKTDDPSSSE